MTSMEQRLAAALRENSSVLHAIGDHPGFVFEECPMARCMKNREILAEYDASEPTRRYVTNTMATYRSLGGDQ